MLIVSVAKSSLPISGWLMRYPTHGTSWRTVKGAILNRPSMYPLPSSMVLAKTVFLIFSKTLGSASVRTPAFKTSPT